MILTGAEVDLFVPSFPELQKIFDLSSFMVGLTLTVNLIAHCISAFFAGTLGDKFGRRPVIIGGVIIFIIGSVACVFANSFTVLILGRILQGIGISGPSVLTCALVSDFYSTNRMQHLMGMVNASVTIAMAFAPVVGSYVNLFFNWRGNFVVLLIMGIVSLILIFLYVPKSQSSQYQGHISISLKEYIPVFKSEKAVLYLILLCFAMQSYWVFIGMSPILYMKDLGVSLEEFGLYQGAIAATFSLGSLSSNHFLKRYGIYNCFLTASFIVLIFFSLIFLLVVFNVKDPLLITLAMLFQAVGMVYPINILWPLAIESVENAKGRIGALLASGRLILSAISIGIASYFYDGSFLVIGTTICITLAISIAACFMLFRKYKVIEE